MRRQVAVIGAGWAGLAAALACQSGGADVTLFEMAPIAGGRARDAGSRTERLDNGQHICIGAYAQTLRLLANVGVAEADAFVRLPLCLVDASGLGLRLRAGPPRWAFARGVMGRKGWSWRERFALLALAATWARNGFSCAPTATVADLTLALTPRIRDEFVEPLCVAALNTPAGDASGSVFLRVLGDALGAGPGASDLLLPRQPLGALLPDPAVARLRELGAQVRLACRVERIAADGALWRLDDQPFDRVVVASSAFEAARLVAPIDADWSAQAAALRYEPIVTVYAASAGCRLPEPMLLMHADAERPAQFVFDRGQLGGPAGLLAFVISGASAWVERGVADTERAVLAQAESALKLHLRGPLAVVRTIHEKRATFRCTPALERPSARIGAGLAAAGDYIDGPYPATLEGAVRSGLAAASLSMA